MTYLSAGAHYTSSWHGGQSISAFMLAARSSSVLSKNNQMTEQTVDMRMDGWKMEWLSVCEMCCARLVNGEKENTRKNQDNQKYFCFLYIALEFVDIIRTERQKQTSRWSQWKQMVSDALDTAPGLHLDHKIVSISSYHLEHSRVDSYCSDKCICTVMCHKHIIGALSPIWQW